jgi:hypothetical protein
MEPAYIPAFVAGLFALLGALIGSWLARRTEYEKWLRQQRSTEFASFLRRMYEIRLEATNAIYSGESDEQARNMAATELFASLRPYESVARLYMCEATRGRFSALIQDLWVNCTVTGGPATRVQKIRQIETDIQSLLEEGLERIPWDVRVRWPL